MLEAMLWLAGPTRPGPAGPEGIPNSAAMETHIYTHAHGTGSLSRTKVRGNISLQGVSPAMIFRYGRHNHLRSVVQAGPRLAPFRNRGSAANDA